MRIGEGVEMLEIGGETGFCPVLLWDESHVVLVDTGLPMQFNLLRAAVARAGKRVEDITEIIITHQDIDHIGCVREVLSEAPGAMVLAHALEAPYLDGRETPVKLAALEAAGEQLPERLKSMRDTLRAGFGARRFAVGRALGHGEQLSFCGGITALHTPGHTPGHLCLYVKDHQVLIAGDALNLEDGTLGGPNPDYTQDMGEATRSLKALLDLDVRTVLCYHGGRFEGDVRSALLQIIERAETTG